jgi:hypothetical protein
VGASTRSRTTEQALRRRKFAPAGQRSTRAG